MLSSQGSRMQSEQPSRTPYVRVGRLESHPDGGWKVRVRQKGEDLEFVGHDGRGLTKDEAEGLLDELDQFVAERN